LHLGEEEEVFDEREDADGRVLFHRRQRIDHGRVEVLLRTAVAALLASTEVAVALALVLAIAVVHGTNERLAAATAAAIAAIAAVVASAATAGTALALAATKVLAASATLAALALL